MATRKINRSADDVAQGVSRAGRRAGATARRAGTKAADAVESATASGAQRLRRTARSSAAAYDSVAEDVNGQVASLEDSIRQNPLAAAGAALLIGVVLGRFVL